MSAEPYRSLHVPREDPALLLALEYLDPDLGDLPGDAGPPDYLDYLCRV